MDLFFDTQGARHLLANDTVATPAPTMTTTPAPTFTDTSTTSHEFLQNLYISVPIGLGLIFVYCIARYYRKSTFETRRNYDSNIRKDENDSDIDLTRSRKDVIQSTYNIGHPELSDGFFAWFYDVWTMDTATFFQFAGLDALVFRMYLKGCVYICLAELPYALFVLLPVYGTGNKNTDDALEMFTILNLGQDSDRLWATVIGAYISFAIALWYLSKVYLVVAYAADQNYVGNAGNRRSLKQIDNMSWRSYLDAVRNIIEFNVNVAITGISKAKGVVDIVAKQATNVIQQGQGLLGRSSDDPNANNVRTDEIESKIEQTNEETMTTALLKSQGSYGATSDAAAAAAASGTQGQRISSDGLDMGSHGSNASGEDIVGTMAVPIDKYTVLVQNLPEKFQNEENFRNFMERLFPGQIHKIYMLKDVRELTEIYKNIEKHEQELKRLHKKYGSEMDNNEPLIERKWGKCCGESVDVKSFHKEELRVLKEQFMVARSNLKSSPTAFVTFKDLQAASVCVTCPIRFGLYPLKIKQAPAPRDIRWANLKFNTLELISNNVLVWFLFVLLLIFWTIPIAAIQALANLEDIFDKLDVNINKILGKSNVDFLQSFVSVLVLDIFLSLLPDLCEKLTKLQRKSSRGKEEILTLTKYFDCLVVMVLLVTVLAGTAFSSLDSFVGSLSDIFYVLATSLVGISTYFLLYILLNAFLWIPLELFRPGYFFKTWFKMKEANRFEYAKWYGKTMLILLICIIYSVMCPFVWILGLFYFVFCTVVFSYQLSMAYVPEFETGAAVWPAVFSRLTFTFNLGIATLIGLLILYKFYVGAALVVPLFLFNGITSSLSLRFRKVFRASSLTSASEKDKLLEKNNNDLPSNWTKKLDMIYYPPIMDIDYNNDGNGSNDNERAINVQSGSSVQASGYQSGV